LERAAQEAGNVDLVVADNQLSSQVALEIADRLIAKEVDLVIEFHIDQKIGSLLADKYKQAGIPVLAIDIPIIGGTFVGVNNHQVGHVAGVALGNWIKANWQGEYDRVIALEEPRASSVPAARILGQLIGFGEVLGEIPDSKIVHVDSGNTTATCQPEVAGVLQQLPDLHRLAVISFNDDSALGALYAAREAGREEDVIIVGQGADRIGREEIRRPNSRLIGSTAFQPEAYGKTLIAIAADILEGKPVPPAVYVKHTFIDSTNIDELYPE
jgi:ribose transport system substrate-binding protein